MNEQRGPTSPCFESDSIYVDSMNDETTVPLSSTLVDGKPSLSFTRCSPIRCYVKENVFRTQSGWTLRMMINRVVDYFSDMLKWYDG